ncbi:DNA-protecting protein DprA [Acinetobacter nosocomialis]|uniref:DNA-processing protein DprA n=1 Tax=Acinetobacter nosocomialis TaxID=106654 RepID=UPI00235FEFA7|nr:DNA-processing protein DprA [Acinetobacter nosocomialis]MDC9815055.1 DNA-protecting protein DprA [Acinetobacter nosocomialis]MDE9404275.1 DNA-protecting protein DprA [Acinetobacter nosocomialis]MDV7563432.1 DNA-processing protein DprA [Acinetobacter baumannii]HDG9760827.1 DNA-protecting protein DprA [Acinetobacter nosocomialis]
MISDKTFKLLAISKLPKIGKAAINQIAKKPINWDDSLERIVLNNLEKYQPVNIIDEIQCWADEIKKIALQQGDSIISQLDDAYPQSLKETFDAPAFLFCRGNLSLLNTKCIAIIGTREPSQDGKTIGYNITKWFSNNNWTIVSGLALGIDTIAHKACLENFGRTIAVLGTNLDKVYPAENKDLLKDIILKGGLVISEYAYDNKGFKSQFVERDRIQAGLSNAVVLVQSSLSGGSMHASKAILKYKRYLIIANQSVSDIAINYPKIEANMTFINSDYKEIGKILNINDINEKQIVKMMHKSEYEFVNKKILEINSLKKDNASFDF